MRHADRAHDARALHSFKSPRDRGHRGRAIERRALSELKSFPRQRLDEARSTFESGNQRGARFRFCGRAEIEHVPGHARRDRTPKTPPALQPESPPPPSAPPPAPPPPPPPPPTSPP